jgi:hypothetical protein
MTTAARQSQRWLVQLGLLPVRAGVSALDDALVLQNGRGAHEPWGWAPQLPDASSVRTRLLLAQVAEHAAAPSHTAGRALADRAIAALAASYCARLDPSDARARQRVKLQTQGLPATGARTLATFDCDDHDAQPQRALLGAEHDAKPRT